MVLLLPVLAGCEASQPLEESIRVADVWARPTRLSGVQTDTQAITETQPGPSAIYLTIVNKGAAADRLLEVRTDVARIVEMHESTEENGVMRMRQVDGIEIPAGEQTNLKPGGYHIMLMDMKRALNVGDAFPVTLVFERRGVLVTRATVRDR